MSKNTGVETPNYLNPEQEFVYCEHTCACGKRHWIRIPYLEGIREGDGYLVKWACLSESIPYFKGDWVKIESLSDKDKTLIIKAEIRKKKKKKSKS